MAPALAVIAVVLFMGAVSGAHLNPAVTLAFSLRGDFPWHRVPGYIAAQFVGDSLASTMLLLVLGRHGRNGMTVPGAGFTDLQPPFR